MSTGQWDAGLPRPIPYFLWNTLIAAVWALYCENVLDTGSGVRGCKGEITLGGVERATFLRGAFNREGGTCNT